MWFSHKRRKDKKDQEEATARQIIEERHAKEKEQPEVADGVLAVATEASEVAASRPQLAVQQNGIARVVEQGQRKDAQPSAQASPEMSLSSKEAPKPAIAIQATEVKAAPG